MIAMGARFNCKPRNEIFNYYVKLKNTTSTVRIRNISKSIFTLDFTKIRKSNSKFANFQLRFDPINYASVLMQIAF